MTTKPSSCKGADKNVRLITIYIWKFDQTCHQFRG